MSADTPRPFFEDSSFYVVTTLRVPPEVRQEFNDWVSAASTDSDLPAYYDYPFEEPFLKPTDIKDTMTRKMIRNDWYMKKSGALVTRPTKCHGAMTALYFCIEGFFAPRGIILNGEVIGVNDSFGMLYIYGVDNNVIRYAPATERYLKQYLPLWCEDDDGLCEPMMSWILTTLGFRRARSFRAIQWYDADEMEDTLRCLMGDDFRDCDDSDGDDSGDDAG